MFDACKTNGQQAVSSLLPFSSIVNVVVQFTPSSVHDPHKPLVHKEQRLCLVKKCVDELREFCKVRIPAVIQTVPNPEAWQFADENDVSGSEVSGSEQPDSESSGNEQSESGSEFGEESTEHATSSPSLAT